MPLDYDFLEEGEKYTAASLNDRFATLETGINNLSPEDIEEGALTSNHLPSMTNDVGTARLDDGTDHFYSNTYPGYNVSSGWDAIATTTAGYLAVGSSLGTGTAAWDNPVDFTDNLLAGILVLANIEVRRIQASGTANGYVFGVFTLAIRDSSNNIFVVPHTERWVKAMNDDFHPGHPTSASYINCEQILAIRSVLGLKNLSDIDSSSSFHSDGIVRDVLLMVSVMDGSLGSAVSGLEVQLRNGILSAIVLRTQVGYSESTTETT